MARYLTAGAAGLALAWALTASPAGRADEPSPTTTVVVTRTVAATFQRKPIRWWARRAVDNRRVRNRQHRELGRLRRVQHRRWSPTVDYAYRLASAVYGVSYWQLRTVGGCESHHYPFAVNGRYRGVMQEGPMFEQGPFRSFGVYDPIANVLTAARVVAREGFRQWQCKP